MGSDFNAWLIDVTTVALGGPVAIFWMWLMALLGAALAFVESTLAQIWKNGMPLVQMAINFQMGEIGIHVVTFVIFRFAFSSLIGNYFYAESNIRFITKSKAVLFVFRLTCLPATECWHVEKDELPHVGPQPVREYFEEAIDADDGAVGLK